MATVFPKLNETLIKCVLEHIENNLSEYDQNRWCWLRDDGQDGEYCGTTGCVAGWAVMLSTPVEKWKDLPSGRENSPSMCRFYRQRGADLLGLTYAEASRLFDVASGDPREALKTVKRRLAEIRDVREAVARVEAALTSKEVTP